MNKLLSKLLACFGLTVLDTKTYQEMNKKIESGENAILNNNELHARHVVNTLKIDDIRAELFDSERLVESVSSTNQLLRTEVAELTNTRDDLIHENNHLKEIIADSINFKTEAENLLPEDLKGVPSVENNSMFTEEELQEEKDIDQQLNNK